jgi:hypothetical protein
MPVIIIGPGMPGGDPKADEAVQTVVEWTHLYRSFGLSAALVMMYGDRPDSTVRASDFDVALGLAKKSMEVYQATRILPTILPVIGKIPDGTNFAGQKYALNVVLLDEELAKMHQEKAVQQ